VTISVSALVPGDIKKQALFKKQRETKRNKPTTSSASNTYSLRHERKYFRKHDKEFLINKATKCYVIHAMHLFTNNVLFSKYIS